MNDALVECYFCGTARTLDAAMDADWIPSFDRDGEEVGGPVCRLCVERERLVFDDELAAFVAPTMPEDPTRDASTPGPWVSNADGLVYSKCADLDTHNVVCHASPEDAALIAAAPELLAALIELASGHSMKGEAIARAAIAKANLR